MTEGICLSTSTLPRYPGNPQKCDSCKTQKVHIKSRNLSHHCTCLLFALITTSSAFSYTFFSSFSCKSSNNTVLENQQKRSILFKNKHFSKQENQGVKDPSAAPHLGHECLVFFMESMQHGMRPHGMHLKRKMISKKVFPIF